MGSQQQAVLELHHQLAGVREQREHHERAHLAALQEHETIAQELEAVHAAINDHHAQQGTPTHSHRPRKATGAFGALAGDDLHVAPRPSASAASSLSAVPERGGSYHRPRKATGAFGALAGDDLHVAPRPSASAASSL
eukprot:COSAG01_NODE_4083_length_5373_cov_13.157945_1_plen_137_part_10